MAIPEALVTALASLLGDRARTDEPLARHTSLRIGGPAELLVLPDTPAELGAALRTAGAHAVRVTLLGGGSNLLVADGGIPGIVVKLGRGFAHLAWRERESGGEVRAGAAGDHAGRLIDVAGLKGARAGRARISERHANFIVNEGGACAVDVKALMDVVQRAVWEQSGVWLEPEVRLLGRW